MSRAMPPPNKRRGLAGILSSIALHGLFLFLAATGLNTLSTGVMWLASGHPRMIAALGAVLVGIAFTALSLGFFYYTYVIQRRRNAHLATIGNRFPNQPWMQRPDWAARRMVHNTMGSAIVLWIETIIWWTALAFVFAGNFNTIGELLTASWTSMALAIPFVFGGFLLLRAAIRATLRWMRFGRAVLRIDTLPGIIGGKFRGKVQTRLPKIHEALEIKLVCEAVRRAAAGNRHKPRPKFEYRKLSESVSKFDVRRIATRDGKAVIPIDIAVPTDGQPSSTDSWDNGVRWKLSIATTGKKDPQHIITFEVPIYRR